MQEKTLLLVARTVHDRDAKLLIGAVTIAHLKHGGGIESAAHGFEDHAVPMQGRDEVVVELDEDVTGAELRSGVPCTDAGGFGLGVDDMPEHGKREAFAVVHVDGEDVLHRIRIRRAIEPEAAGVAGDDGATTGGMQETDLGTVGLEVIQLAGVGLVEAIVGTKGHGVEMHGEVTIELATLVPDVFRRRWERDHHLSIRECGTGIVEAELARDHLTKSFAAIRAGIEGLQQVLLLSPNIAGHLGDVDQ